MISAGELTERITFQQKSVTQNEISEDVTGFADVCTVWAKVMPLRGAAFIAANQQQHTVDARFLIRSRADISVSMRLIWKGDVYDVTNLIPGTAQYKGTLEVMAIKGVFDGR